MNQQTTSRQWFRITTFLFGIAVVGGLFIVWSMRNVPFSSSLWKERPSIRSLMIEDLMQKDLILGKTRDEVDSLLGNPSGRDIVSDNLYVYWAGTSGIDDMWLEVVFKEGQAVDVKYVPD